MCSKGRVYQVVARLLLFYGSNTWPWWVAGERTPGVHRARINCGTIAPKRPGGQFKTLATTFNKNLVPISEFKTWKRCKEQDDGKWHNHKKIFIPIFRSIFDTYSTKTWLTRADRVWTAVHVNQGHMRIEEHLACSQDERPTYTSSRRVCACTLCIIV